MKKLLQLSFLLLFFTACNKKDDDKVEPEPITPVAGCHLTKMEIPGVAAMQFTYNPAGYVTKRENIYQGSSNSEHHEYVYNAQNQLITDKFFDNGTLEYQKDFEYSNGLLTKTKTTEGSHVSEEQYNYDANQRLTEVKLVNTAQDFKSIYEYDTKGSRLTCCTIAEGERTPRAGKRKLDEESDSDEGEGVPDNDSDGFSGLEESDNGDNYDNNGNDDNAE